MKRLILVIAVLGSLCFGVQEAKASTNVGVNAYVKRESGAACGTTCSYHIYRAGWSNTVGVSGSVSDYTTYWLDYALGQTVAFENRSFNAWTTVASGNTYTTYATKPCPTGGGFWSSDSHTMNVYEPAYTCWPYTCYHYDKAHMASLVLNEGNGCNV